MEFYLKAKDGAFPCEVTIDEDNGRYTIRKAVTSGEFFDTPQELVKWIMDNWRSDYFQDEEQFQQMMSCLAFMLPVNGHRMKTLNERARSSALCNTVLVKNKPGRRLGRRPFSSSGRVV